MALSWSGRRKLLYTGVAGAILAVIALWVGISIFSKPPTCFDGKQNQGEQGIDCGGPCARICTFNVRAPVVLWTRALPTSPHTYTAVAYIQNPNAGERAGARGVHYVFRLLDNSNTLIIEKSGVADLPPQEIIPIVEPNIETGDRPVAHVFFDFDTTFGDIVWDTIPQSSLQPLRLTDQSPAQSSPLSATLVNDGTQSARDVTVAAVLFDQTDTVIAASKSLITRIDSGASQNVVFTWSATTSAAVRAELTIVPALP